MPFCARRAAAVAAVIFLTVLGSNFGRPAHAGTLHTEACTQSLTVQSSGGCGTGGGGGSPPPKPTPTPAPPAIIGVDFLISAQINTNYNDAFAWCTNPHFSDRSGEGDGTFFGITRSVFLPGYWPLGGGNRNTPYIFVGFQDGDFLGGTLRWNGYGIDYFDGSNETLYTVNRTVYPANDGQMTAFSDGARVASVAQAFRATQSARVATQTYVSYVTSGSPGGGASRADVSPQRVVYVLSDTVAGTVNSFGHTFVSPNVVRVIDAASGDVLSVTLSGGLQP